MKKKQVKMLKSKSKKITGLKKKGKKALKLFYYRGLCTFLNPVSPGLDPYEGSPIKRKLTRLVPGNKKSAVCLCITFELNGGNYGVWLARKAKAEKIECFVYKFKQDGLEAILVGPGAKLEAIVQTAWKGPRRTRVANVQERWFNKPVKFGRKIKKANSIPWSFKTANSIRENLIPLTPLLEKPNQFDECSEKGSDELVKAAKARGFFVIRFSNSSYIISPNKKVGIQFAEIASVSNNLRAITNNKQITKDILSHYGLPTPGGAVFQDISMAKDYMCQCGFPLVVKPLEGSMGRGITVDVRTEDALLIAWNFAQTVHRHVILEELVPGVDVRVLVIGGKAKAAQMRVPAHIVGDGEHSVAHLIDKKNKERLKNPRLDKKLIKLDAYSYQFIERQNHSMTSIPQKGEVVFLHLKANLSAGGDNIVVTEQINPDLLRLAEEAAATLGVNDFWGIDLLVENIFLTRHQQKCKIVEVNSRAALRGVQYPLYGKPVQAPQALIDYLFLEELNDTHYPVQSKRLTITGFLNSAFLEWIYQQAKGLGVKGHIGLVDDAAEALFYGHEHLILCLLEKLWSFEDENHRILVDGLYLRDYNGEVEEGFSINTTVHKSCAPRKKVFPEKFDSTQFDIIAYGLSKVTYNINIDLIVNELGNRGYEAVPLNEELIRVQKGSAYGIAGLYYSSGFADNVCHSMHFTKKFLAFHGFPVLRGLRVKCRNIKKALNYFGRARGSCIATIISSGRYHTYYINGTKRLREICKKASDKGIGYMLLEKSPKGCHVCIAVVVDHAVAAMAVESTCIQGDGKTSMEDLIKQKNDFRRQNPWYQDNLVEVNDKLKQRLASTGYQMEDVPAAGKKIVLKGSTCYELNGDTIGITDIVHDDFKDKAVQAVKAVPGLEFAYVHMVIPFPEQPADTQDWVITKLDTKPQVAAFHYPWRGQPCNLAEKVVSNLCLTERTVWLSAGKGSMSDYLANTVPDLFGKKADPRDGDMDTVIQKVKRYHDENEHLYPLGRRFHYNSRMYLHTGSRRYLDTLYSLKGEWGKSRDWFVKNARSVPKTKGIEHTLDIEKRYREDSINKHYKVKLYNRVFFKALFQEKIFRDIMPLKEMIDTKDIRQVREDLLNDEKSLLILSTPAVNFLYNYNYFMEDEVFDPSFLLAMGEKEINIDELSYFHAKIYFYTHAIVGASRFYTEKIHLHREKYEQMLKRVENMVLQNNEKVSLDQKFEILVCSKLLNVDSIIREDVKQEAVQSLSNKGDYFVDVLNDYNNEENIKTTFSKSEHRNVLGIMAFYDPGEEINKG